MHGGIAGCVKKFSKGISSGSSSISAHRWRGGSLVLRISALLARGFKQLSERLMSLPSNRVAAGQLGDLARLGDLLGKLRVLTCPSGDAQRLGGNIGLVSSFCGSSTTLAASTSALSSSGTVRPASMPAFIGGLLQHLETPPKGRAAVVIRASLD
jgi:hypothetical protein